MQDAKCILFKPLLLSLDSASQYIIFKPIRIKVFNLYIQVNLSSVIELDLSMSLEHLMYYRGIIHLPMTVKMPYYSGIFVVPDVIEMTLKLSYFRLLLRIMANPCIVLTIVGLIVHT